MKKTLDEMTVGMQEDGVEERVEEFGDMVVSHVHLPANYDPAPIFEALPGGHCPIPHWGMILEGAVHLRYEDGTVEVTREGEFFHWPPGHVIWTEGSGVKFIDVAPAEESRRVTELLGM